MSEPKKKKRPPKKSLTNYEEKVKFNGTFEQLIKIAVKQKGKKQ